MMIDLSGLKSLNARRADICEAFINNVKKSATEPLFSLISESASSRNKHGYNLKSGDSTASTFSANTDRFRNFVTMKYRLP